jgi:hypothetical protein
VGSSISAEEADCLRSSIASIRFLAASRPLCLRSTAVVRRWTMMAIAMTVATMRDRPTMTGILTPFHEASAVLFEF